MKTSRIGELWLNSEVSNRHLTKKRDVATWEMKGNTKKQIAFNKIRMKFHKESKSLQELHLFGGYLRIPDKSLASLRQYFKEFRALKSLCLMPHFSISQAGIYHLSEGFKRLSSLEKIDLYFSNGNSSMNDQGLNTLAQGLRTQISLRKIRLDFLICNQITDLGIRNLCRGLQNLVFLRSLALNFNSCQMITDEGMVRIRKLLKNLKNLQNINLSFHLCHGISLDGIEQVTQGLKSLDLSKDLGLYFYKGSCFLKVTDFGRGFLRRISFEMRFWGQNMKDEFGALENLLNKYTGLRYLNFTLADLSEIGESGLKYLSQIWNNFAWLQSKSFALVIGKEIDQKETKHLVPFLESLAPVNYVHLDFSMCSEIHEKVLQDLSRSLVKHPLESLRIRFGSCENVVDDELEKISRNFGNIASVKILGLHFQNKISDSGVEKIVQGLKNFGAIKTALLNFYQENSITQAGRERMIETLNRHKSLQQVNIYFGLKLEASERWEKHNKKFNSNLQVLEDWEKHNNNNQVKDKGGQSRRPKSFFGRITNFFKKKKKVERS